LFGSGLNSDRTVDRGVVIIDGGVDAGYWRCWVDSRGDRVWVA
jgi:hypothetical protein